MQRITAFICAAIAGAATVPILMSALGLQIGNGIAGTAMLAAIGAIIALALTASNIRRPPHQALIRGGHCRDCGAEVRARDEFCFNCGVRHPGLRNPLQALGAVGGRTSENQPTRRAPTYARNRNAGLIAGLFACGFGIIGIFSVGIVFVPLAGLCCVIGLLRGLSGRGSGFAVSVLGGVLTTIGFVSSPSLWFLAAGLLAASRPNNDASTGTAETVLAAEPSPSILAGSGSQLPSRAKELYEGRWNASKECVYRVDDDTGTLIDLNDVTRNGVPTPIFHQRNNHCLIEHRYPMNPSSSTTVMDLNCFESWGASEERVGGRKATVKLTMNGKNSLDIDGKQYYRCDPPQSDTSKIPSSTPAKPTVLQQAIRKQLSIEKVLRK